MSALERPRADPQDSVYLNENHHCRVLRANHCNGTPGGQCFNQVAIFVYLLLLFDKYCNNENNWFGQFRPSHEFVHQGWKTNSHCMGASVRKYDPTPPEIEESVDVDKFNFQMIKVDKVAGKQGWESFRFNIPPNIRALHESDVIWGSEWRQLLLDFDQKFL